MAEKLHSAREIAIQLNNLTVLARMPATLGYAIPDGRLKKLRAYAEAIVDPLYRHLDEDLLLPEELVFVLVACALMVQAGRVVGAGRLPAVEQAELLAPRTRKRGEGSGENLRKEKKSERRA